MVSVQLYISDAGGALNVGLADDVPPWVRSQFEKYQVYKNEMTTTGVRTRGLTALVAAAGLGVMVVAAAAASATTVLDFGSFSDGQPVLSAYPHVTAQNRTQRAFTTPAGALVSPGPGSLWLWL